MTASPTLAPPRSEKRRRSGGWPAAGLLLVLALAALPLIVQGRYFVGTDFAVYHATGEAVLAGRSPYEVVLQGGFAYLYPPFAAVLLAPLGLLGRHPALAAWTLASAAALLASAGVCVQDVRAASIRRRAALTVCAAVAALPLTPVLLNLWFGQINMFVVALVVADLARRPGRLRGIGVGIAAGIKLTPLIFVGYLLLTRQFRAARTALLAFLGTVLLGFLVLPGPSWTYWTATFADTSRMYPAGADDSWNHSLRGLLEVHGISSAWVWWIAAAAVGTAGLLAARRAARRGDELAGVVACGITGLLVSPVSWSPHWVWCVPLLVVLAGRAAADRRWVPPLLVLWLAFAMQSYEWVGFVALSRPVWPLQPAVFTHVVVGAGLVALALLAVAPRASRR